MKIVELKFKKGLKEPIKDNQPSYEFLCPFSKVEVGSMVTVEVKKNRKHDFKIGRVESVRDLKITRDTPRETVVAVMPFKDFEVHCDKLHDFKTDVYNQAEVLRQKARLRKKEKRMAIIEKQQKLSQQ